MAATFRAIQKGEHLVQVVHPEGEAPPIDRRLLAGINWDDLRLFLHVADGGSFRSAASLARVSVNTVRTRVARLEDRIGDQLLFRNYEGVKLTPAGASLRRIALSMRGVAVTDGIEGSGYLRRPDELRIGTSEGLGSGWLTPHLLDLQQQFPALTVTLLCDNDLETDHSDELDLAVVFRMPRNPDLVVSKLATLHFMPFASRNYVKENGVPRTPEDLLNHRFIEQCSPGVRSELLDQLVGTERPPGFLPIRTNSSLAIFWAVANDAGIAFMPTYAAALVDKLEPIDLPFQLKFDIFYAYHSEARSCEIVTTGVEWLKECFDPKRYPWFRSEFVHPNDFQPKSQGNIVPLFNSLASASLG